MYKILIVDDEPEVVNWLFELISDLQTYEIEVYKAFSAFEAIEWLEKTKVDIVLSDIKMPGMNGLQLLERISGDWPFCKVIFLTGYKKFDHIYSAVQKHKVRYLLKIEKDETILKTVIESIEEIDRELMDKNLLNEAQKQLNEFSRILKAEFLNEVINGLTSIENIDGDTLSQYKISFNLENPIFMFLGRFDNLPVNTILSNRKRYLQSIKILSNQHLSYKYNVECFNDPYSNFVWLVQPITNPQNTSKEKMSTQALMGSLENIQTSCRKSLDMSISFFVGTQSFCLQDSASKYMELRQLMRYRIGLGKEMILSDLNLPKSNLKENTGTESPLNGAFSELHRINQFENLIESGRQEDFLHLLKLIIECLRDVKSRNNQRALEIYYTISLFFLNYINRRNFVGVLSQNISLHKLTRPDDHQSWNDAVEYLYSLSLEIFKMQSELGNKRADDAIAKIQSYIQKNLHDDLSLVRLADLVFFNQTYLSRLYKQVTGMKLSDYIFQQRMIKAKELLMKTYMKINEISAEIGYESPNSFTRSFKIHFGISPQRYRESHS